MHRQFTRVALAALAMVLLLGNIAHAQDDTPQSQSSLALSPAIIEHILDPGQPVAFTLQVNNITNFPLPVKAIVKDFTVQSVELEKTEKERLDASEWINIAEPDFILQPRQTRAVEGTINPPAAAIPGGHYATIYFQPLIPHDILSPATAYMNSRVGALVFLNVKGDVDQHLEYAKGLQTPGFIQRGPVNFTFSLQNSGDVHVMPSGKIKVFSWQNKQVAQLDLPVSIILPDATKEFTVPWDAPHALGKYRAELEISYGDQSLKKVVAEVWILPWPELLFGTLAAAGLAFFVLKTRHRWSRAWRVLRGKDIRFK